MADLASVIRAHANDPVEIALNPGQYADAVRSVLNLHFTTDHPFVRHQGKPIKICASCGPIELGKQHCKTVRAIASDLGVGA